MKKRKEKNFQKKKKHSPRFLRPTQANPLNIVLWLVTIPEQIRHSGLETPPNHPFNIANAVISVPIPEQIHRIGPFESRAASHSCYSEGTEVSEQTNTKKNSVYEKKKKMLLRVDNKAIAIGHA